MKKNCLLKAYGDEALTLGLVTVLLLNQKGSPKTNRRLACLYGLVGLAKIVVSVLADRTPIKKRDV